MDRSLRIALSTAALAALLGPGAGRAPSAFAGADDESAPTAGSRDVPSAFAPLEYLLGQWKGQGVPRDDPARRFRGWTEEHSWAWVFQKGTPTGLSVAIKGGKILASGRLTYDAARRQYRLEGTAPGAAHEAIVFEGKLDASGKLLTLDQVAGAAKKDDAGTLRLSFRPNSNFVRYTMRVDHKNAGAFRYGPGIEVGVTKEGESFAASSATAANRPRCIITGGAATMTLTYQGRTFPICCTGCRDEFQADPQKYIKKASLRAAGAQGKGATKRPAPARVGRFDDAFSDDVVEDPGTKGGPAAQTENGQSSSAMKRKAAPTARRSSDDDGKSASDDVSHSKKPAPAEAAGPDDKSADKQAAAKQAKRAATLLRIGQNLEKSGNSAAALGYYRRVVKDYAKSASARTARKRIQAIEKE